MESVDKQSNNNEVLQEKENGGYFGYYVFVTISGIIGFVSVLLSLRFAIDFRQGSPVDYWSKNKDVVSILVALLAVIIFTIVSILFKEKLKKIYFSEIFLYIYIGFLTTVVSFLTFSYFNGILNANGEKGSYGWIIAEILSFIIAVTFAFFADKIVVFKSLNFEFKKVLSELGLFVSGRLLAEGIAIGLMYLIINILKRSEVLAKTIACIIVIIVNYLLSKYLIFKKAEEKSSK